MREIRKILLGGDIGRGEESLLLKLAKEISLPIFGVRTLMYDDRIDPETGGAYLLKKLVKKGGKVLLRSLNGDYRDIEIASGDDIKIVAEFKSVLRA